MERHFRDVDAVHADDLEKLLLRVGLLEKFKAGELKCKFCHTVVNADNIYSVIKDSGQYKVVCDRAECVSLLMQFLNERKKPGELNG